MYESFESLLGKTLKIVLVDEHNDQIRFTTDEGDVYLMHHIQDCCENVYIKEVVGDLNDIVGSPIVRAEENSSNDRPDDADRESYSDDSSTWTFYRLGTAKGTVVFSWYGTSNGYYSESVNFERIETGRGGI